MKALPQPISLNLLATTHRKLKHSISKLFTRKQQSLTFKIKRAVSKLPKQIKLVFILHVIKGLSHEQIAQLLSISPATSKMWLMTAKYRLKQELLSLQKGVSYVQNTQR
ncbi:MAG: sigma-70 family RNA polymerase sigma factor [Acidobacteriota bacterium]|nr:sigma-70 family RNA polymerase sigma factor [Blastocatellia bacterium]MDW8412618.1 sigma-70 family RNA polymerase sigma factor [Acidobacteriota bacterium]